MTVNIASNIIYIIYTLQLHTLPKNNMAPESILKII